MAQGLAQGVVVDGAAEVVGPAFFLQEFHKHFGQGLSLVGAACEVDFDCGDVDVREEGGELFSGSFLDAEAQRGHALVEHVLCDAVGLFGALGHDFLAGEPVVVGACAADVRIFAGQRVGGLKVLDVLAPVNGLDIEALVGSPYQFLVKVGAFEVCLDFGTPFVISGGGELVEQFFFIVCHDS